jgi:hypothetical protein
MRVDLSLFAAWKFFDRELPRRAIFHELEENGLHVTDWGCSRRSYTDDGGEYGSGYHEHFIIFASVEQAVQFKLIYL